MKCYIAGPMRGLPYFNFPAFDDLAAYMRAFGWHVFNPAEHDREVYDMNAWPGFPSGDTDGCPGFSIHDAMRWDLARICESQAIILLPGWEASSGTSNEVKVAEWCGVEKLYAYQAEPAPFKYGDFSQFEWFVSDVYLDEVKV